MDYVKQAVKKIRRHLELDILRLPHWFRSTRGIELPILQNLFVLAWFYDIHILDRYKFSSLLFFESNAKGFREYTFDNYIPVVAGLGVEKERNSNMMEKKIISMLSKEVGAIME